MKKIFTTLLLSVLAVCAFGQSFGFQFDENDEPYLSGPITYECQPATAWNRLVTYINSTYTAEQNEIAIDQDNHVITVTGGRENSKVRVNPFAGAFGDYILYKLVLSMNEAGEMTYLFNDLTMNSQAKGFANYNRTKSLRVAIKEFKQAKRQASDPTVPRKEQNEAKNTMKDLNSSITNAYETLSNRIQSIKISVE